ncbi:class I SAM-dependent methyltransferase [Nitrogeniibacter mangrovi]|uniref:Class I SAM-dependent methyltransferase n=1 Tax=Nitrogeniibacter mangrovi TaxID=2016596 RepID=A0A6C1B0I4_9RHOO|nr:cyclopropane-fatty-acyl-phospholipid synthase family protein [Nitrogeniibacter mangrovi]QID17077.1 class I SAM-dependent methyltransferase [Nitrogeniibacter mangrovi]
MTAQENVLQCRLPRLSARLPGRVRAVLALLDSLEHGGVLMTLPGAGTVQLGQGAPVAHWTVRDLACFDRVIARGDIGLGEAWMDGLWHTDHLPELLAWLSRNRDRLGRRVHGRTWQLAAYRLWHLLRANTRRGSRRNIEAHYDLGNDFYALWLDRTMTYSSACFASADEPLERAQTRKYQRILDALGAQPGQRILEIGCGWGGFAEVAAAQGCQVHGLTLSPAQLAYARQRAEAGGWHDRAQFELRDYRDVGGRFDHVVSIEMVEAVGERYWPRYFEQIARCLAPHGKAVIQAITIDEALFPAYRAGTDFIQQYIFPGGMLPTPARLEAAAQPTGLAALAHVCFGQDYARTLRRWAEAFDAQGEAVRRQGFDRRFVRMWQFYLAYCEAGFRTGDLDVCHATFGHAGA